MFLGRMACGYSAYRTNLFMCLCVCGVLCWGPAMVAGAPSRISVVMVDDFDGEPNHLSNMFGGRGIVEPICTVPLTEQITIMGGFFSGNALKFVYNHNCADTGWYTALGGQDEARPRDLGNAVALSFRARGLYSTSRMRVGLTDATGASATEDITGIDSNYAEWTIDLTTGFVGVDLAQLTTLSFLVPQDYSDDPDGVGILYFDEIYFRTDAVDPTSDEGFLLELGRRCFNYFWDLADPNTGFAPDRATGESVASVAGVGYQLASLPVGVRHGWVSREDAAARARQIMSSLRFAPQRPDGTVADESVYAGYKGFFYHFLDSSTAERVWTCELSTIDSAICYLGVIDALMFFDDELSFDETVLRADAQAILDRVEWSFFYDVGGNFLRMAWSPEGGIAGHWGTFTDEVLHMTLLAATIGSSPAPTDVFYGWGRDQRHYQSYAVSPSLTGALFTFYQAHGWLDLRGRTDRHWSTPVNWYRNGWGATLAQRAFAVSESGSFATFGPNAWGLSDSSTPGAGYQAVIAQPRISAEPDVHSGTVAPSAAASTLPLFLGDRATNLSLDAVMHFFEGFDDVAGIPRLWKVYGLADAYNETGSSFWYGNEYIALTQGSTLLAVDYYLTDGETARRVASYPPLAATIDAVMWPAYDVANNIAYSREGEQYDAHSGTPGMVIEWHGNASSWYTLQLGDTPGNYTEYVVKNYWTAGESYRLTLDYSEDVGGNVLAVEWDGDEIGRFTSVYSGGWDSFVTSPTFEIGEVGPGDHTVRVININGGTYGVQLDVIRVYANHKPADFDGDGDVDLADFASFSRCFGGGGVAPTGECVLRDLDDDNDVDADDFAHFQTLFAGP